MLAYRVVGDLLDEYICMSESTSLDTVYRLSKVVVQVFGVEYLRESNVLVTARLLSINVSRGFTEIVGSIDCMHWE